MCARGVFPSTPHPAGGMMVVPVRRQGKSSWGISGPTAALQERIPQCRDQQHSMNQQGWVSCGELVCEWHWECQGVRVAPIAL